MNPQIKSNIFSLTLWAFCQVSLYAHSHSPSFFFSDFLLLPASALPAVNPEGTSFRMWFHRHTSLMQIWSVKSPLPCLSTFSRSLSCICFCSCRMNQSRLKLRLRNQSSLKLPVFSQASMISSTPTMDNKQYKNRTSSSHSSLEYCSSFQHFVAQGSPEAEEVFAVFIFRSVPNSTELDFHRERKQNSIRVAKRWHWEGIVATGGK